MIGLNPISEYAIGEIDSVYDLSTPDLFKKILNSGDVDFVYLIELQPFNQEKQASVEGYPPIGTGALNEFDFTYKGGVETIYISDKGYMTEPTDTPSNVSYHPVTTNPYQFEVSILSGKVFGGNPPSFGAIRILNGDGEFDYITDYFWGGRAVKIYVGTKDLPRESFYKAFDGLISQIEYGETDIIVTIQNKAQILETEFTQSLYSGLGGLNGSDDLEGTPKPLVYGDVKNIAPVLVDPANLIYQVHDGSCESISNVFDRGIALTNAGDVADIEAETVTSGSFVTQLSGGYIKLGSSPDGRITADVEGDNTGGYVCNAGAILSRLVRTKLGYRNFTSADIDQGALNRLDRNISGCVGVYIDTATTLKAVLDTLINPLQAYWTFTRDGLITGGVIDEPVNSILTITEDDIYQDEISIKQIIPPAWRIKLNYGKSWTVQTKDDLATAVTALRQAFVSEEYRALVDEDRGIVSKTAALNEKEFTTLLSDESDALNELDRLKRLFRVERKVYRAKLNDQLFKVYVGDTVTLKINRFSLSQGKAFVVTSISEDAETNSINVEIFG